MITIEHKYRNHISGSKFYETTLFARDDGGPSVLVKRFGKVVYARAGGQTKVEDYPTASAARAEQARIWREKDKPKEYSVVAESGSHIERALDDAGGLPSLVVAGRAAIVALTKGQYGSSSGMDDTIADFLKMEDKYDPLADMGDIIETEPEEPVDRGETWGSW